MTSYRLRNYAIPMAATVGASVFGIAILMVGVNIGAKGYSSTTTVTATSTATVNGKRVVFRKQVSVIRTGIPVTMPNTVVTQYVTKAITRAPIPNVTVTRPGPTVAITAPGPTVTVTAPGPTVTITAPGPTVTVTASP